MFFPTTRWHFSQFLKFCQVLLWPSHGTRAKYPSKLVMSPPEGRKSTWQDLTAAPYYIIILNFSFTFIIGEKSKRTCQGKTDLLLLKEK